MELKCPECDCKKFVAQAAWLFVLDEKGDYMYQVDVRRTGNFLYKQLINQFKDHSIVCMSCGTEVHIGDTELLRKGLPYLEKLQERLESNTGEGKQGEVSEDETERDGV